MVDYDPWLNTDEHKNKENEGNKANMPSYSSLFKQTIKPRISKNMDWVKTRKLNDELEDLGNQISKRLKIQDSY